MDLSACAASTSGSLKCRWFYGCKRHNSSIKEKDDRRRKFKKKAQNKTGNKKLKKRDRKEIQGIEWTKEMDRRKVK